jgi:hypothetical protein
MGRWARRGAVLAVAASALLLGAGAGCIVVTGGTNGYAQEYSGSTLAVVLDAAVCGCSAGQVCCASESTGGLACQDAGPCGFGTLQICASSAECQTQDCIVQTCATQQVTLTLPACGLIDGCITLDGGTFASPVDSGVLPVVDSGGGLAALDGG